MEQPLSPAIFLLFKYSNNEDLYLIAYLKLQNGLK